MADRRTSAGKEADRSLRSERLRLLADTILTFDDRRRVIERGVVVIEGGRIAFVGERSEAPPSSAGERVVSLEPMVLLPGFVQAHVHLCQALFRNQADDLALLDWLRERIWPFEAAHDPESLAASAELGIAELLRGGTTAILDMATVRHTEVVFETAKRLGIRATIGKCHMDVDAGQPRALFEETASSIGEAIALAERYHMEANGRLRYAFAPRFVLSCTEGLFREVAAQARALGLRLHTHASEQAPECERVRELTGRDNIEYFHDIGFAGSDTVLAHCVHARPHELELLARSGTHVAHCPSANLKLGSGIAPVPRFLERGINVALGADGAPCNNNLDQLLEMRLAALVQKPVHGPQAMPARTVLELATRGGARALGLEGEVGEIAPGRRADLIALDLRDLSAVPVRDPYAAIVYAAKTHCVRHVWVDGVQRVRDGVLVGLDVARTVARAEEEFSRLARRAGL